MNDLAIAELHERIDSVVEFLKEHHEGHRAQDDTNKALNAAIATSNDVLRGVKSDTYFLIHMLGVLVSILDEKHTPGLKANMRYNLEHMKVTSQQLADKATCFEILDSYWKPE